MTAALGPLNGGDFSEVSLAELRGRPFAPQ